MGWPFGSLLLFWLLAFSTLAFAKFNLRLLPGTRNLWLDFPNFTVTLTAQSDDGLPIVVQWYLAYKDPRTESVHYLHPSDPTSAIFVAINSSPETTSYLIRCSALHPNGEVDEQYRTIYVSAVPTTKKYYLKPRADTVRPFPIVEPPSLLGFKPFWSPRTESEEQKQRERRDSAWETLLLGFAAWTKGSEEQILRLDSDDYKMSWCNTGGVLLWIMSAVSHAYSAAGVCCQLESVAKGGNSPMTPRDWEAHLRCMDALSRTPLNDVHVKIPAHPWPYER